ncbi:MAG: long-chain fatty acid--CoA ligase [Acidobacteria bacterium]|nr:long-chain fatty acid--CoA ligase [Acidobacteriota bacterium]
MAGSDILLPSRFLQGEPLSKLIDGERPTVTGGVPTIWSDVSRYAEAHRLDLSSIRAMFCAGSAVPRSLIERFDRIHGVRMTQAWGMTETSPLAASANAPKWCATEDEAMAYRALAGRGFAGVGYRISSEGVVQPNDGQAVGEIQVRGPWVTGIYLGGEGADKFEDGWLKTGDVGTLDAHGFITITDRAKDVIKSGGEWVSSVEVENAIMAHSDVLEAAVIGVPDPRWDERPLACVVLKPGSEATAASLRAFLGDRVAKWCVPDRWAFIDEVPKTSVGKFYKKTLRARFAAGEICVAAE